jgi:hypothetical protein
MPHAATPLDAGYGKTRFASPSRAFKVLYLAEDLTTSIAETLLRDRFQGKARRQLMLSEVDLWGVTEVSGMLPLTLIDLRTTGVLRLGVSTEAVRGKAQGQGRTLSQTAYEQTDAAGLLLSFASYRTDLHLPLRTRLPASLTASPVQKILSGNQCTRRTSMWHLPRCLPKEKVLKTSRRAFGVAPTILRGG